jgi:uncharacterized iron-regulated membrane protein
MFVMLFGYGNLPILSIARVLILADLIIGILMLFNKKPFRYWRVFLGKIKLRRKRNALQQPKLILKMFALNNKRKKL